MFCSVKLDEIPGAAQECPVYRRTSLDVCLQGVLGSQSPPDDTRLFCPVDMALHFPACPRFPGSKKIPERKSVRLSPGSNGGGEGYAQRA